VVALLFVVSNLLVDISYAYFDPAFGMRRKANDPKFRARSMLVITLRRLARSYSALWGCAWCAP